MNSQTYTCNGAGSERVRYFSRQLITADDMLAEQDYFRQKLRRHNRYVHGWGVVCGLQVIAAPDDKNKTPWRVKIDAGYALGPYGDEIYVPQPFCYDLAQCLELIPDPCEPGEPPKPVPPKSGELYVAIRYLECETRPIRVHPLGCACEDTLCEYSRIRDDFEISCLAEPPKIEIPALCELHNSKQLTPCPPCPDSPWVVLAKVVLPSIQTPAAGGQPGELAAALTPLTDGDIDNFTFRPQIYSTAIIQKQVIDCCCEEREEPPVQPIPARVAKIDPEDNAIIYTDFVQTVDQVVEVVFDKEVKGETVNMNTILITSETLGAVKNVLSVDYHTNPPTAVLKAQLLSNIGGIVYNVTVKGNPPEYVIDVDELALDGDADQARIPGGDFESKFILYAKSPEPPA